MELKRVVDNAWDDADFAINREIEAIVADHAVRGLLRSGGTIRRVVRAAEPLAKAAVDAGRASIRGSRSTILRLKLSEFQAARVRAYAGSIEARLDGLGLGDKAGKVLLAEAMERATRPEPDVPVKTQPSKRLAWAKKAAAYVGDKIIVALIVAVIGAAIIAALKLN